MRKKEELVWDTIVEVDAMVWGFCESWSVLAFATSVKAPILSLSSRLRRVWKSNMLIGSRAIVVVISRAELGFGGFLATKAKARLCSKHVGLAIWLRAGFGIISGDVYRIHREDSQLPQQREV